MGGFKLKRLGLVMEREPGNPVGVERLRIALALSADLFHWQRLGLATFGPYHGVEAGGVDDKDASLFPGAIPNPSGHPELAILHRPLFPGTRPEETVRHPASCDVDLDRESIWISYCRMVMESSGPNRLGQFTSHHRLAARLPRGSGSKSAAALRQS